jgi:Animal haem peroxidase
VSILRHTLVASAVLLATAAPAGAVPPGTFTRLLPNAPPLSSPTDAELVALAQTMREDAGNNQPDNNTSFVLGQFLDHDIVLDEEPSPTAPVNISSLDNVRNANLDLDSVYGDGPDGDPALYDGARLRVGVSNGIPDVPRDPDGTAVVGEGRNDENLVIAQLHAGFLRFHNQLVDQGMTFDEARLTTIRQWQWLVLNEYLPRFAGDVPRLAPGVYNPGNRHDPILPVEFAVAAFRFGHSQVRGAYRLNATGPVRQVFSLDPNVQTLLGGRPIPADAGIEWRRFFDVGAPTAGGEFNAGRRIDTEIASGLFELPIPSVVAGGGSNVLALRNMQRGVAYALASYESTATALGVTPIDVGQTVGLPAGFEDGTPLWFGLLAESEVTTGGERLGPTAARIVNEVLRTNIERDPNHLPEFVPPVRSTGELLRFAGVVQ